ncbi:two-partner secretion domain-containing protein [Mastigocladopsis repens]|uniref:two-partner secretion domain-containing protein n=1 Tax=Mastigocladopsis repens TaxID=221287 RepID=UPI00030727B8|nr:filamentous hemagglutinin N-terminal domain-containing protein [Mastigocladopsis repens]
MSFGEIRLDWWQSLGIAIGSAIILYANSSIAQITPDATLPNNSNVGLEGNTRIIEGGTTRGGNLFHSFSEFSVPNGATAFFNNAQDIQNIISRVTGKSISEIDGLIKANGRANLFLINPNGIIFGKDARLDIGGSFLATTASSLKFADDSLFSTSLDTTNTSLLTISVPIGLQYGSNPGSIQLQGSNLQVNTGKTLALLGGNLSMDGGKLSALGGQVELGGLAGTGTVGLNIDSTGNLLSLSFPSQVQRADVSLTNQAQVDVTAAGGGSIAVNARNLDILGRSSLNAGISNNSGSVDTNAGNITVDATETVTLTESSLIANQINSGATGTSGTINLVASSLNLFSGSQLFTSTYGQGNAGNVNVNVRDAISVDGENPGISTSGIISSVAETGVGNGGDISITTGSMAVTNGAQLNTLTLNQGDAGNVSINARDTVSFDGAGNNGGASGILSSVGTTGVGNAGEINITAGSLSLTGGAQLNALTQGQGDAGNVNINARDTVSFDGANINGGVSGAFSSVDETGVGNGGNIDITTGSLSLTGGAGLYVITQGQGNAGKVRIEARDTVSIHGVNSNGGSSGIFSSVDTTGVGNSGDIEITTGSLLLTNGGGLFASTSGQGDAGNVNINARDRVSFDGVNSVSGGGSGIYSSVEAQGVGKGGDITITTNSLSATNGGGLFASTSGQGDAGNVNINARDRVSFDGVNSVYGGGSGIYSSVEAQGVGKGGDITITTNSLSATNGGGLFASTSGQGDAGNVNINARDRVSFDGVNSIYGGGSGIYSSVEAQGVGKGGDINITTASLSLTSSALVSASSLGQGTAGDIEVTSGSIKLDKQADIQAETASGNGGNINLRVEDLLLLRRNSQVSTNAGTAQAGGDGGNITINAPNGFIVAVPNENSDITANAYTGTGGRVQINTFGIYGTQFRDEENPQTSDITASSQFGRSGSVEQNTSVTEPDSGLINLPSVPVDTEVAQGCNSPNYAQSSFIITGRGGLPPNPKDVLTPDAVQIDWVSLNPEVEKSSSTNISTNPNTTPPAPIVEATGWVFGSKGEVIFTAQTPTQHQSSWQTSPKCHEK